MSTRPYKEPLLRLLLVAVGLAVAGLIVEAGTRWYFYAQKGPEGLAQMNLYRGLLRKVQVRGPTGEELNQLAWEATYTERGVEIPPFGPREGYWADRIRPQQSPCGDLDVCERAQRIPKLVEIYERGFQHVGPRDAELRILIVGGSVAFGAYASTLETTYFSILQRRLSAEFPSIALSVLGRGGSVSMEDFQAFTLHGVVVKPDLVVMLNGLNDLTNRPGHGPAESIRLYRRSVRLTTRFGKLIGIPTVFIAQPFLGGKLEKTPLERRLLDLTVENYENTVNPWYRRLIAEGRDLAKKEGALAYIDYSDLLSDQSQGIFADQWHFSDFGHQILAEALARDLERLLDHVVAQREASQRGATSAETP